MYYDVLELYVIPIPMEWVHSHWNAIFDLFFIKFGSLIDHNQKPCIPHPPTHIHPHRHRERERERERERGREIEREREREGESERSQSQIERSSRLRCNDAME
jgi:hypothetical protein